MFQKAHARFQMAMAEELVPNRSRRFLPGGFGVGRIAAAILLLGVVALASTARVESGGAPSDSTVAAVALTISVAIVLIAIAFAGVFVTGYASLVATRLREKAFLVAVGV